MAQKETSIKKSKNRSMRKKCFGLIKDKRGASAVEFSLVAPIFLTFMMSTFEVGWFYFVNSIVDAATVNVSRFVRTGQAQNGGFDKDSFFADEVCPRLAFFGDCNAKITAEVRTFNSFEELAADTSQPTCRNDDPQDISDIPYDPGTDNMIVRVRICALYDTLNPTIGLNLSEDGSGTRRLTTSYVFRNEPYSRNNPNQATSE